jgi:nucleotide-binding universal stress UspA family protein
VAGDIIVLCGKQIKEAAKPSIQDLWQGRTMKSILAVAHDPKIFPSTLAITQLVAERFDSYVEGMVVRVMAAPVASYVGMSGVYVTTIEGLEAEESIRAEKLKDTFKAFMQGRQTTPEDHKAGKASVIANWPIDEPQTVEMVGERGRVFDLIVVGRSGDDLVVSDSHVIEAALFDSGRPVLIAPSNVPKSIGSTVLVAWNGASESARAVAFAMPFLKRANHVSVLEVEGGSVSGPNAQDVQTYLTRIGISSEANSVEPGGVEIGQAILDEAAAQKADLIVKGAYTHSRLRQLIFGGATKHLLTNADIPVLMAH